MYSLDTLLNDPSPSAAESDLFEESDDFDFSKDLDDGMDDFEEDDDDMDFDDIDDDFDDTDDNDDDVDDDLYDLEAELGVNGGLEDDDDEDTFIPTAVDDPTPAPELSPEEDKDADRSLAMVATPIVLNETLTAEEAAEFVENGEADIAVSEGIMMESAMVDMLNDLAQSDFMEAGVFANPKQKYKMTKKARFNQLYELSLQIEARHHNDPYYKKLQKAYKIERTIKKGFRKRYHALAVKRARRYLKKISMSKSPIMRKAATSFKPTLK